MFSSSRQSEFVKLQMKLFLYFFVFFLVCRASVNVEVAPTVEAMKGEAAQLPCKYTVSPPVTNTIVEWYIVSHS